MVAKENTCLSRKELQIIAQDYNDTVNDPNKQIKLNQSKAALYEQIRSALEKYCGNEEHCWVEQKFVKQNHQRELSNAYRPVKPREWYKNPRTWLNTFDILDVMKQYEKKHKNFLFLGVYPIDFQSTYSNGQCIGDFKLANQRHDLCNFHIKNLIINKKSQFAMVLNLDDHTQSGSHWVSVYCSLKQKDKNFGIYYYDSVAYPPGKEVKKFMTQIKNQVDELFPQNKLRQDEAVSKQGGKRLAPTFEIKHNTTRRQYKNTECGVFSMVFLTSIIDSLDFDSVCQNIQYDDAVNSIRDIFYRPNLAIGF
jgi:hypothetical protein